MDLNLLEQIKKNAESKSIKFLEAKLVKDITKSINIRLGEVESVFYSEENSISIRLITNEKQQVTASFSELSTENVDNLVDSSIEMAKALPIDEALDYNADAKIEIDEDIELDLYDDTNISIDEMKEKAMECEKIALANEQITNSEGASFSVSNSESHILLANNSLLKNKSSSFSLGVNIIAGQDLNMQYGSYYHLARHLEDLFSAEYIANEAKNNVIQKLNPIKMESGKYPVIFSNKASPKLISYLMSAISGYAIYRNTSFLVDDLNKEIFNKNINITDNPLIKRGLSSFIYDMEGFKANKLDIIQEGKLVTWLLDIYSANKLGLKSNARAGRGNKPYVCNGNIFVGLSNTTEEEMINDIKYGLYVTSSFGPGVNLLTGDFSQGIVGILIENGKLTKAVNEVTIASNLKEIFKNLQVANNYNKWGSIFCPAIFIPEMSISS